MNRWQATLAVYFAPRVLIVILLGFSAGLPLALSTSTLSLWMADKGVDISTIGLFALVGLPYTLKFLWAPVIDAWQIPFLCRWLGRRRGWLIATQLGLIVAIVLLGWLDPKTATYWVAAGAVMVAAASATQDIVIDAFRVESLPSEEQAAGMAGYVAAYRIALLFASAGVLALVAWLEMRGIASDDVWFYGYAVTAALIVIGIVAVLLAREPEIDAERPTEGGSFYRLLVTSVTAFTDFLTRPQAIAIMLFVLLFKFCDSMAGVFTGPFVITSGFDKLTYAGIVKGVGTIAVLAGGFAGGFLAKAVSMPKALWIAGILQMLSNLAFSWLALQGVDKTALTIAIVVENVAGGIGTVVFVAYLSALCSSPLHTATQFALLTALASVGRTVLSAYGGFIAEATGWFWFFAITAAAALPGLAVLAWLQARGHFRDLTGPR